MSVQEFAGRFRDPFLREALTRLFDLPDFPLFAATMTLAWMHKRSAGYPIGGSLAFIRGIERRYTELGGRIHFRAPVADVLVEDDAAGGPRAVGVRLEDGSEHRSGRVVSAADGHTTLYTMLHGRFLDDSVRRIYDRRQIFPPLVRVSLGVARDLSAEPHAVVHLLPEPVVVAGVEQRAVMTRHYCYDPTTAERGKSSVAVLLTSDHEYWRVLAADRTAYAAEKERVAAFAIGVLRSHLPDIDGHIEVVDVATPLTFERYTGNWQGSPEGVLITTRNLTRPMRKTLPGLDDFYQVGHWVQPGGGLPSGVLTGREVAQLICAADGQSFRTTRPAPVRAAPGPTPREGREPASADQVTLSGAEVRAFSSLLTRVSERLAAYEEQTHPDKRHAEELRAAADDLLGRLGQDARTGPPVATAGRTG
jgi:phytoene dehydrogenase-like protein